MINRKRIVGVLVIVATVVLSFVLVSIPNERLIGALGAENVYVFMYVLAFLGGITTFAGIPYPLVLLGLAAGGVDPLKIGFVTALGVITADTLTFFAARKGSVLLNDRLRASLEVVSGYVHRYPRLVTPGLVVYGCIAPLSNDFAVISFSLMRYAYRKVVLPLAVGNIIHNIAVAYLGVYAYDWIVSLM